MVQILSVKTREFFLRAGFELLSIHVSEMRR